MLFVMLQGSVVLEKVGGLHKFMGWRRALLTVSTTWQPWQHKPHQSVNRNRIMVSYIQLGLNSSVCSHNNTWKLKGGQRDSAWGRRLDKAILASLHNTHYFLLCRHKPSTEITLKLSLFVCMFVCSFCLFLSTAQDSGGYQMVSLLKLAEITEVRDCS